MSATPDLTPSDVVDRRAELLHLHDQLRSAIDSLDTPASALAALSRELRTVMSELDGLKPEEGSILDDLAARRDARIAAAPASAAPRSQPRRRGRSTGSA